MIFVCAQPVFMNRSQLEDFNVTSHPFHRVTGSAVTVSLGHFTPLYWNFFLFIVRSHVYGNLTVNTESNLLLFFTPSQPGQLSKSHYAHGWSSRRLFTCSRKLTKDGLTLHTCQKDRDRERVCVCVCVCVCGCVCV